MDRLATFISSRRGAVVTVIASLFLIGGVMGGLAVKATTASPLDLPTSAESARVQAIQATLPSAVTTTAVIVIDRHGAAFTASDEKAITSLYASRLQTFTAPGTSGFTQYSSHAAVIVIPLVNNRDSKVMSDLAQKIEDRSTTALAGRGLRVFLTGPVGVESDLGKVFNGADLKLLLATVVVVALLLVLTYRSALLWLVPLIVMGSASQVAATLAARLLPHLGLTFDDATSGILSVLVFGAGTDYSFLVISRYRDELRQNADRRAAMAAAWRGSVPAVTASGATVALSLVTLAAALIPSTRSLGVACALGVVVAVIAAITFLPAALALFGRGLFWPVIPRVGDDHAHERGYFAKLARAVSARPLVATVGSLLVLGILASGVGQSSIGLSLAQSFRSTPPSIVGEQVLAANFPAGAANPTYIVTPHASRAALETRVAHVPGAVNLMFVEESSTWSEYQVSLTSAPDTPESYRTISDLRHALRGLPHTYVGGDVAQSYDSSRAQRHDRNLLIPLVLAVVLLTLILVLRALLAPVLLLLTVIASYFSALGASEWLFKYAFSFPALDVGVPLIAFIFLAALGSDYNIFLVSRIIEERRHVSHVDAVNRGLSVTGVVITSAGILLAAVFAVLGVLPLITLTQIGVIVGVGVLLDTLLVRTVLVPALAVLSGDRFWWPRRPR
jgi:RND superfamily putative drug exporter